MITVYGSNVCPGTLHTLERLTSHGIMPNFVNVTGSIGLLKEFMLLRDTHPAFDDVRGQARVGFPVFQLEDGTVTRDVEKVMEMLGISD